MKKLLFPLFMLAMIVTSCEKDPDMNKLDSDYSVYTDYDNSVHFNEFSTYYLPDSILVPDNSLKANYWKDENAQNIISAVAHEMGQKGYVRTEDKEKANVGIQLSYAQQRIQMTTGGWYGGWWDAGFWGPYWGGERPWGFYVSPELGMDIHPVPYQRLGFHVAVYYSYATNKTGILTYSEDGRNSMGVRVGVCF